MAFERFTKPARLLLVAAGREATARGDDCVATDHVLLAVLRRTQPPADSDVEVVARALERCGLSLAAVEDALSVRGLSREQRRSGGEHRMGFTVEHGQALDALAATTGPIRPRDVVASIVEHPGGDAARLLAQLGLPAAAVLAALAEL